MTTRPKMPELLGQIRAVKTSHSTTYKLDPFCTSYLEFQRRAKDEMSKLLNLLIRYGCKQETAAEFRRYGGEPVPQSCSRITSFDYYYLLKHIGCSRNAAKYAGLLGLDKREVTRPSYELQKVRNRLAHQAYLDEEMKSPSSRLAGTKQRSPQYTEEFIIKSITFAEKIQGGVRDSQIEQEMETVIGNLHGIQESLKEFKQYKEHEVQSVRVYDRMSPGQRKQKALDTLEAISEFIEKGGGSDEVTEYIATRLAARCQV